MSLQLLKGFKTPGIHDCCTRKQHDYMSPTVSGQHSACSPGLSKWTTRTVGSSESQCSGPSREPRCPARWQVLPRPASGMPPQLSACLWLQKHTGTCVAQHSTAQHSSQHSTNHADGNLQLYHALIIYHHRCKPQANHTLGSHVECMQLCSDCMRPAD